MNRYDLLVEAYDHFDNAILEMVLTDTVKDFCIENEGGFKFIEEYINLLESGQTTKQHLEDFSAAITETYTSHLSSYLGLIYEATPEEMKDNFGMVAPLKTKSGFQNFVDDTLKPKSNKALDKGKELLDKATVKAKDLKDKAAPKWDEFKNKSEEFIDNAKTKATDFKNTATPKWNELKSKVIGLKDKLKDYDYKGAIKKGWERAKEYTATKATNLGKAVTGGIANLRKNAAKTIARTSGKVAKFIRPLKTIKT